MEILNDAYVTPQRFHALLRLVSLLQQPTREMIQNCLQPDSLYKNQEASRGVINYALALGILTEEASILRLAEDVPSDLEDTEQYRRFMQRCLTGVIQRGAHNYLLNEFAAWYAVQNERATYMKAEELASSFSNELYDRTDDDEGRAFNDTKFNGWRNWASFLGWGYVYRIQNAFPSRFVPDAFVRIKGVLPAVLPSGDWVTMSTFMENLGSCCPELDGGILFNRCWQASRPNENRGSQISLILSTGLRVSQKQRCLELKLEPDASDVWQLKPAHGMMNRMSHIRRIMQ